MSNKKSKKDATKNNKKASKNIKTHTVRFDNDAEIPAKTACIKDIEWSRTNNIDIDKTRVSDKKLCNKEHNSHKYYEFYEHDDKYIPLKIILRDVVGYKDNSITNDFKDNSKYDSKYSAKRMNFRT